MKEKDLTSLHCAWETWQGVKVMSAVPGGHKGRMIFNHLQRIDFLPKTKGGTN